MGDYGEEVNSSYDRVSRKTPIALLYNIGWIDPSLQNIQSKCAVIRHLCDVVFKDLKPQNFAIIFYDYRSA